MGEESTVPGSVTVCWRRRATLAAVIPVASSLTLLRCGLRPNSGQSSSRRVEAAVELGIAAATVVDGERPAGALPPHATSRAHASAAKQERKRSPRADIAPAF